MSTPASTPEDIDRLISHVVEGSISSTDMQVLDELICTRPEVRQRYYGLMHTHTCLNWRLNGGAHFNTQDVRESGLILDVIEQQTVLADEERQADLDWITQYESEIYKEAQAKASGEINKDVVTAGQLVSLTGYLIGQALTSKPAYKVCGVAAAVLLAVTLFLVFAGEEDTAPSAVADQAGPEIEVDPPVVSTSAIVATLTAERDAVWQPPQAERALARGSKLKAGDKLTLTAGVAEITTAQGAVAILQAPATIELIDSPNALRLHTGKLVGLCHSDASKGFVVKTDHADITDLGTEFGVEVKDDNVTTTVFTGEVELTTPGGMSQPLTANQTASVRVQDSRREVVVKDRLAEGFDQLIRPALVTDARINLNGFEVQVVPRGVREDAKLYSDRDHELNGVDADGLPSFLLGGDLVRMPGNARPSLTPTVGDRLRLEIELSAPADVYLLVSEDEEPPNWLTRDYERTEWVAGVDFVGPLHDNSRAPRNGDTNPGGIGPGVSIDQQHVFWKRKQPALGRLVVAEAIDKSMYSLIALPIDHTP